MTWFVLIPSVSYMPPTPTVRQNGPAIRAFREIRGLTVEQLADRVGLSPQSVRNIELEHKGLTKVKANRVCEALVVDLAAIIRDHLPKLADGQGRPSAINEERKRETA